MASHVAGMSRINPIAPARLVIGRPCQDVSPPLSARMTRSTQATGTPNHVDASAISRRQRSTESAWAGMAASSAAVITRHCNAPAPAVHRCLAMVRAHYRPRPQQMRFADDVDTAGRTEVATIERRGRVRQQEARAVAKRHPTLPPGQPAAAAIERPTLSDGPAVDDDLWPHGTDGFADMATTRFTSGTSAGI